MLCADRSHGPRGVTSTEAEIRIATDPCDILSHKAACTRVSKAWLRAKCKVEISPCLFPVERCQTLLFSSEKQRRPGDCTQLRLLREGRLQRAGSDPEDPWLAWHLWDRISSERHLKHISPPSLFQQAL